MITNFNKNSLYTVGIEEEYMLCDSNNYDLIDKANVIMNKISSDYNNLENRFSYELILSEIESNTSVCNNVDEAIKELIIYRNILKDIGSNDFFKIGISGTHPTALSSEQSFVDNESYNWVRNEMQYYASKNITFSTHIHIGINDANIAVKITNALRRWISPMLALSTNSPFFEGLLTGMESTRTFQFGNFPRTNIPFYMNSIKEYLEIVDNFIKNKSIEKPGQIWWKIRPHIDYGTIEFRMCDVQRSLNNTKMLASIAQALVRTIYNNKDYNNCNYNQNYLEDSLWKAASKGVNSTSIDPINEKVISMKEMIYKMINYCEESLHYFNNYDFVKKCINSIFSDGTESFKQKIIYNDKGFEGLKKYLIDNVNYK